jgi:hypothetical protein
MTTNLVDRIVEASDGLPALAKSLARAKNVLGDETLIKFLDAMPTHGAAIWSGFRHFQTEVMKSNAAFELYVMHVLKPFSAEGVQKLKDAAKL